MSDFRKQLLEQAKKSAEQNLKNHRVRQRHRDGDTVRLWRCDNNGSSVYHFTVCAPPGWLIVYGDMGECMWSRTPDMIQFARESINSLGYFSEKVSRDCKIRELRSELAEEWFSTIRDEWKQCGRKWTKEHSAALKSIRHEFDNYGLLEDFRKAIYESILCSDSDDLPDLECYTYHYLWKIEALKWFLAKLDAGEVVVDPYDWSEQK
jgi:hypothetical protein